jgi:hypothetical protein
MGTQNNSVCAQEAAQGVGQEACPAGYALRISISQAGMDILLPVLAVASYSLGFNIVCDMATVQARAQQVTGRKPC